MGSCIKAKMFLKKKNRDPLFSLTHCHPPSDLMGDDRCLIYSSCNLFLSTLETPPDSFSSWRSIDRRNLAVVNLCPQAGEEKYFFWQPVEYSAHGRLFRH